MAPRFLEASRCPAHSLAAYPKHAPPGASSREGDTTSPTRNVPSNASCCSNTPAKLRKGWSQAAGRQLTSRPPAALLEPSRVLERKENARPLGTEPATPCRPYGSPSTHAGSGGTRNGGHLDMNPARDAWSWSLCAARTGTKTRLWRSVARPGPRWARHLAANGRARSTRAS